MPFQKRNRLVNHTKILVRRDPQSFSHVEIPRLPHNRGDPRTRAEKGLKPAVTADRNVGPAGQAKGHKARVAQAQPSGLPEEVPVLRVAAWPPALHVVHAEGVQSLENPKLVLFGKADLLGLVSFP